MDFTVEGARDLLRTLQEAGYSFVHFGDEIPATHSVLLRHDVDLDLEDALTIAHMEADLGVSAQFFVLVSSPLYNVLSRRSQYILRNIIGLGHRVGVHIDPAAYVDTTAIPQQALSLHLADEAALISAVTDTEVSAFSLHRPSDWDSTYPEDDCGLTSAYAQRYFKDIHYSSDSEGWWRFGPFVESTEFANRRSLQLLLHPEWWTGEPGEQPGPRLDRLLREQSIRACSDVVATINPYGPYRDGTGGWPDGSTTRPESARH